MSGHPARCTHITELMSLPTCQAGRVIPCPPLRGIWSLAREHTARERWSRDPDPSRAQQGRWLCCTDVRDCFLVLSGHLCRCGSLNDHRCVRPTALPPRPRHFFLLSFLFCLVVCLVCFFNSVPSSVKWGQYSFCLCTPRLWGTQSSAW